MAWIESRKSYSLGLIEVKNFAIQVLLSVFVNLSFAFASFFLFYTSLFLHFTLLFFFLPVCLTFIVLPSFYFSSFFFPSLQ